MRFCLVSGLVIKLGVGIWFNPVSAQIIPDATLGSEGSRFIEGVEIDRIEGGAARGVNLFHSFTEFNVLDGQQVYFANPGGIENILSRVTGGNGSTILGTLGVLGNANLFLVNPNGIVFGPNARLDVAGSFVASTGNGFNFSDGSSFSATNPEAPPLLTINVTPGLQYGVSQPQAEIINQGNLRVGQDFSLVGNRLTLSGQLEAGRDLTLLATDTVEIRDSVSNPFIAKAGGELIVQGNETVDIFALNHPDSGLFSGGDMVLRSANTVGGDAHYWSGGSFRIEQLDSSLGSLSSPNDPVIRASGDVSFDSYTGASLHIFAGGSVTVKGGITITGADAINGIQETVTLSDGTTVVEIDGKTKPTLDIRAGTTAFGTPGVTGTFYPSVPDTEGTGTSADIRVDGEIKNDGGTVFLTNQYQPNSALAGGDIIVGNIYTSSFRGDGGSITIDARGDITTGNLNSYSSSRDSKNDSGDGGDITLSTTNGNITTTGTLYSYSYSLSDNSGNDSGNGGAITLSATNGNITTKKTFFSDSSSLSGNSGNGGNITLSAANDITIENILFSYSYSQSGNSGNGGAITLFATNGNIQIVEIRSFGSFSYSKKGNSGAGGAISLSAKEGNILGSNRLFMDTFSVSEQEEKSAKNGGNVTIEAQNTVSNLEILSISSGADAGNVEVRGFGDLSLTHTNITTSRSQPIRIFLNDKPIEFEVGQKGSSGNVTVTSTGNLTFNNSQINSDTQGSGSAGDVRIYSPSLVTFNNYSQIRSDTSSKGQAGNIQIDGDQVLLDNSTISSAVNLGDAKDAAGTITVEAGIIEMRNNAVVKADSNSTESAPGEITLSAINQLSIQNSRVTSDSQNNVDGYGTIQIEATQGSVVLNQATVSAKNEGSDFAADIFINARDELSIANQSAISADGNYGRIFVGYSSTEDYDNNTGIRPQAIAINNSQVTTTNKVTDNVDEVTRSLPAGEINLRATGNTSITSSTLLGTTAGSGEGGSIGIKTGSLSLTSSQLNATTSGTGRAGNVLITAEGEVSLGGGQISTSVEAGANVPSDQRSEIKINAGNLSITDRGSISASVNAGATGNAGDVTINAENGRVELGQQSQISSAVEQKAEGNAGSVTINTQQLTLNDAQATVSSTGEGIAGTLTVNAPSVLLDDQAKLTATTEEGSGGNIKLQNLSFLQLRNGSEISASTESGTGGNVSVEASGGTIALSGNSRLAAEATKNGNAGNVDITASGVTLNSGGQITAETDSGTSTAEQGNIFLRELNTLQVNNSRISSSTNTGKAGNVEITADEVTLDGIFNFEGTEQGGVLAQATGDGGNAGSVTFNTSRLSLDNDAEISASNVSGNEGGDVTLQGLTSLSLSNDSEISASTQTGQAGSVSVNDGDGENPAASVTLNNSRISAQATGDGGNAGNVMINAETLFLNNGEITAETRGKGQGANITLNLTDWLRLENESLISAEAFDDANGGNVKINLTANHGILFALPSNRNGSDIIAKADQGTGGNITITAPLGIYGIKERKAIDGNRTNDIDASSQFGAPGQITINSVVIDPSQGLIELPTDTAAPQLDQTCSPTGSGKNEFTVTGRDGLPPSPTDILTPEQPLADLGTPINSTATQPTPNPTPPASPKPIVEAQGWIIDEQGNVTLVANVPTANSQGAWQPQVSCQGGR
ncbi:haemagglutination activity domain protein [Coleofasciculus chthonoplastes PCC 7420]|uniref:Haemagglutination activity domain protein n=2 Tax=Coleofasciculus chthonoplastes TaxID=64178 RepID=B4VZK7_9CYAN|nr:haemagglutination activity domain protein [Coleofasciculus chthonoplastes PCC 7420]